MKIWYLILGGLLLIPIFYFVMSGSSASSQLTQAYTRYTEGERASTVAVRKEAFNDSLEIYKTLDTSFSPTFGNGKLYFNIANCYFQLEQYPWAIYYYYKAEALRPRDGKVTQNLQIANKKLGIAQEKKTAVAKYFSLPERLQLFFVFSVLALGFASMQIWSYSSLGKKMTFFFSFIAGILFLNLIYSHFLGPVEGVLIKAASLYRDAGEQYAKVSDKPILSGTKVEILDTQDHGKWLKIQTPEGTLGFIPNDTLRIIDPQG